MICNIRSLIHTVRINYSKKQPVRLMLCLKFTNACWAYTEVKVCLKSASEKSTGFSDNREVLKFCILKYCLDCSLWNMEEYLALCCWSFLFLLLRFPFLVSFPVWLCHCCLYSICIKGDGIIFHLFFFSSQNSAIYTLLIYTYIYLYIYSAVAEMQDVDIMMIHFTEKLWRTGFHFWCWCLTRCGTSVGELCDTSLTKSVHLGFLVNALIRDLNGIYLRFVSAVISVAILHIKLIETILQDHDVYETERKKKRGKERKKKREKKTPYLMI